MQIPAWALARVFVAADQPAGRPFPLEEFAALLHAAAPPQPNLPAGWGAQLPYWGAPKAFAEKLRSDAALAAELQKALTPFDKRKLDPPPVGISALLPGAYPLAGGEHVAAMALCVLAKDWGGIPAGTLFLERKTNLAHIYFGLLGVRWDLASGKRQASALLPQEDGSGASDGSNAGAILSAIGQIVLETIGTLSWATSKGPQVSAVIGIVQWFFGLAFGSTGPSLSQQIQAVGKQVVDAIKQEKIDRALDAVISYQDWLAANMTALDTQSAEEYMGAVTGSGFLSKFDHQLGPEENSLFFLVDRLPQDDDLKGTLRANGAYPSREAWLRAECKLQLYLFALSLYLTTLKLKMVVLARLFDFGYDENGHELKHRGRHPDGVFKVFCQALKTQGELAAAIIPNVRDRRLAMISTVDGVRTQVGYSQNKQSVGWWTSHLGRRDALFLQGASAQLVRDRADRPDTGGFEVDYTHDDRRHWNSAPKVWYREWQRMEIRDRGADDGKAEQDFLLKNYDSRQYAVDERRWQSIQAAYRKGVEAVLDQWAKVPGILTRTHEDALNLWQPTLPKDLPGPSKLAIAAWGEGKAKPESVWANPNAWVRYRISVTSTAGLDSDVSDDRTSSAWARPDGKHTPTVLVPAFAAGGSPESFKYVDVMRIHRQFRIEQADGSYKYIRMVVVESLSRGKDGLFLTPYVDELPTDHEDKAVAEHNWDSV